MDRPFTIKNIAPTLFEQKYVDSLLSLYFLCLQTFKKKNQAIRCMDIDNRECTNFDYYLYWITDRDLWCIFLALKENKRNRTDKNIFGKKINT